MLYLNLLPEELFNEIALNIIDENDLDNLDNLIYTINYEKLFTLRYNINKPIKFLYGIINYNWKRLYIQILTESKDIKRDILKMYFNKLKYNGEKMKITKGCNWLFEKKRSKNGIIPAFLILINELDVSNIFRFLTLCRYKFNTEIMYMYIATEILTQKWVYIDYLSFIMYLWYCNRNIIKMIDIDILVNYFSKIISIFKYVEDYKYSKLLLRASYRCYLTDKKLSLKLFGVYQGSFHYHVIDNPSIYYLLRKYRFFQIYIRNN